MADDKLRALGLISQGMPVREVSAKLEIGYAKLLKWKKEYEESLECNKVSKVLDVPALIVNRIANEVKDDVQALGTSDDLEGEIVDFVDGVDGLNKLSVELQSTAVALSKSIKQMSALQPGPSELIMLVEALSTLQTAFFSKNVTNVNVLNAAGAPQGGAFNGFKSKG